MGNDGLSKYSQFENKFQFITYIGYSAEDTQNKLKNGINYKLAIFPEENCIPATWESVFKIID